MLFIKQQTKNSLWGIWKIEESKEELISCFENKEFLTKSIFNLKIEHNILQRLAVRVLLKELLHKEVEICYHETGKPYLCDEDINLSISHTKGYVALILSSQKYVGIDIQFIVEKIKRIRNKFISEKEYINPKDELIHLLLHWSAKETLYKALGGGINLKEHFFIDHFTPKEEGCFQATEKVTGLDHKFNIAYKVTPDFVFTYII